ncbi:hypothetical protein EG329_012063 [Mollisiaceae sp. DMI_Dod_QoI]|nr:hypothetical protein EG329_012063 [Helotiales sp. DMI_Dod_QoI]
MSQSAASPDLGTLSALPFELRERIYGLALDFDEALSPMEINPSLKEPPFEPHCHHPDCICALPGKNKSPFKISLLLVSKAIYTEARLVLFRVNEFKIEVDQDPPARGTSLANPNISIMGLPGWSMSFSQGFGAHKSVFSRLQTAALDRDNIWPELRFIHVNVGSGQGFPGGGVKEYDILPWKRQTRSGPERPSFMPLLKVVNDVCELLKKCKQLHILRITLRSIEKTPGSIEMVLDPLRQLRGVKKTSTVCMGMQDDMWVDWNLKGSYGRYLSKILALPEGVQAPKYVGDEIEPNQSDKEIFDTIGGRWCGGRIFTYPYDMELDDPSDDDMDYIEDFDGFGALTEFLEYMRVHWPYFQGLFGPTGPPRPWVDFEPSESGDENEGENDEDEDGDDEDEDGLTHDLVEEVDYED